ncbi:MAG: hypothetical protein L3K18_05565 [Thermoplasmata archaeon]|nr:hypothetical protein [Thermoplasmata archaeon]MCI4356594.1 hypothetical protein [Thermoplasmata archaeon]
MDFAEEVRSSLDSVLFWGPDRTMAALCALAVTRHSVGPLTWLDIRDPAGGTDDCQPILERLVANAPRFSTRTATDLAPVDPESNPALWTVIRHDEPSATVAPLLDFLRLPRMFESILEGPASPAAPMVLLSTNVDRIVHLYPEDTEMTRRFHRATKDQSVKLVASFCGPGRNDRFAFGHVFRLVPGGSGTPDAWTILEEKEGAPESRRGGIPVDRLDSVRSILAESRSFRDPLRPP